MRSNISSSGQLLALSPRQIDVLQLVAEGKADKEIAYSFGLAQQTVKNTVQDIRVRLCAASRAHAVGLGLRESIIKFPNGAK